MSYRYEMRPAQGLDAQHLDADNILDLADSGNAVILDSEGYRQRERAAWKAKLHAAPDERLTLKAIIEEWLTGCYDAEIAVGWLYALRLLQDAGDADCYEVMSNLAFFEFGPVELPERVSATIPSVSRSEPFLPQADGGAI